MKPSAPTSVLGLGATLCDAAVAILSLTGPATAASAAAQIPAGGDGLAVSLTASSSAAPVRHPVTLTATTNTDVGPTPYFITIYSETTGAELANCGFGTTCTATVAQAGPGTQTFEAFVGDNVPGNGRPGFALVASNEVQVGWWFIFRGPGVARARGPIGPLA